MTKSGDEMSAKVVTGLEDLGLTRGVLHQMAKRGQLLDLSCEMPDCLCPHGRTFFEKKENPMPRWAPNIDHYPVLKSQKGELKADNVRLAHVHCNNSDFAIRSKISAMLKKHMSLEEIAAKLNGAGGPAPYGGPKWTAATVRRALVSSDGRRRLEHAAPDHQLEAARRQPGPRCRHPPHVRSTEASARGTGHRPLEHDRARGQPPTRHAG